MLADQLPSALSTRLDGTLTVGIPGQLPRVFARSEIAILPHTTLRVKDAQGRSSVYTGVLVSTLLERAGVSLSGERTLSTYVMVESVQEPHVLFAFAELDTALTKKRVILAYAKDGQLLTKPDGPWRIIVSDETKPTRWVRQVWSIYVVPDS
jgi:hypothetical protein